MRKLLLLFIFGYPFLVLHGQRPCYNSFYQAEMSARYPGIILQRAAVESFTRDVIRKRPLGIFSTPDSGTAMPSTITIPVVVHILYHSSQENISEAQVQSQLDVLNADYSRTNKDASGTPAAFRNVAADCGFRFVLARVDPQGYGTNGIVRKQTSNNVFGVNDDIKFAAKGGDDAWDPNRYLNIWVGNLQSGYIGYASVIGGPMERDGVVIQYTAFGIIGILQSPYNFGRTATHEIGHWLNLIHIWGDANCGDDHVDDTPPQQTSTSGCPSGVISSCNNGPNGNMYSNYMDFTNDQCMNLFTKGQRDRMRSLFEPGGYRYSLLSSNALTSTPLPSPYRNDNNGDLTSGLSVYPNPASSTVQVRMNGNFVAGSTVEVYSLEGRKLMSELMNRQDQTLNIASLKPGIYFVKINGGSVSRLVKL